MIVHGQRVGQLHPEFQPLPGRQRLQPADESNRLSVRDVVLEHRVGDGDLSEAQAVVQDVHDLLFAQQGRVQLDHGVQLALGKQVLTDALDLIWRAAVHGGEGDAVGDLGRDLDVSELATQNRLDLADLLGCVHHLVHELAHARALDALQVVADAHIEDDAW